MKDCSGSMEWPQRGVYFIFEGGENRALENSLRVVRVGTHAVSQGSKSTLWSRIKTHKGSTDGFGNHRSSIFRLHVGEAFINKSPESFDTSSWEKI
jgi:hypothetical protein